MSIIVRNLKYSFICPIPVPIPDAGSRLPGFPYARSCRDRQNFIFFVVHLNVCDLNESYIIYTLSNQECFDEAI